MADGIPVPGQGSQEEKTAAEVKRAVENLATAVLFIIIGIAAFLLALDYPIGTLHRMGPGLFPLLVSAILTCIGLTLALQTVFSVRLARPSRLLPEFRTIRALLFVMLSLLAFAVLIRPAGLCIATAAMAFIATRAEPGRRIGPALVLSVSLSAISALIFVVGIGLPIPLWP